MPPIHSNHRRSEIVLYCLGTSFSLPLAAKELVEFNHFQFNQSPNLSTHYLKHPITILDFSGASSPLPEESCLRSVRSYFSIGDTAQIPLHAEYEKRNYSAVLPHFGQTKVMPVIMVWRMGEPQCLHVIPFFFLSIVFPQLHDIGEGC
jgi:hypothetical protein